MMKSTMTLKCISIVAHLEGLTDAMVLCGVHCQMQHVQGYTRSLWTPLPPLGNYLLRIALTATGVTGNTTTMKKCTKFAGHFDGRGGAPVRYRAHCSIEEVQGFTRSHWMPSLGEYCSQ
jgi:hypothetical protein